MISVVCVVLGDKPFATARVIFHTQLYETYVTLLSPFVFFFLLTISSFSPWEGRPKVQGFVSDFFLYQGYKTAEDIVPKNEPKI